jgi:hypothetical protein
MADPLGGDAESQERPPPYAEDVDGGLPGRQCQSPEAPTTLWLKRRWWVPWEAVPEPRSTHHLILQMLMVGPLGVVPEPECAHHLMLKMMVGPQGGGAGARERPPTYVEDIAWRAPMEVQSLSMV